MTKQEKIRLWVFVGILVISEVLWSPIQEMLLFLLWNVGRDGWGQLYYDHQLSRFLILFLQIYSVTEIIKPNLHRVKEEKWRLPIVLLGIFFILFIFVALFFIYFIEQGFSVQYILF